MGGSEVTAECRNFGGSWIRRVEGGAIGALALRSSKQAQAWTRTERRVGAADVTTNRGEPPRASSWSVRFCCVASAPALETLHSSPRKGH